MEKFFWADQIAKEIIKRNKGKKVYACASGIGVSGTLHIGNFRDAITTDLVVKSLENMGKKVRFIYSWEDYDRFRKVPANVPKEFEKYIGMPVSEIPSPFSSEKNKNYVEYFKTEFVKELKKVGINPEFISQSKMYKNCKYASLIKLAMDKRKEIMNVLNKYRKEHLKKDWYPVRIYCEKCKKDFTKILNVNDYEIEYECACGFKDKFDYRKKGILKLGWRVDWPMRWFYEKIDFEPGGADLGAAGGSMMTSDEIVKKIFKYNPPFHVYYEWIRIKGGKEFSGSAGNALTINDVLKVYEAEILRYLFVRTRPNKGFQISFDNDVIKIYEDFDSLERKYYEKLATSQEKRIYELSVTKLRKTKPKKINFRHLITMVQVGKIKSLNKEDKTRAGKVSNWINKYAGEDMKFEIQDKIKTNLTKKQKEALISLKKVLTNKKLNESQLFNEFYDICKSVEINNKEFFESAYRTIINKNKGPRLADLILVTGKEKIIKLLNQIK